MDLGTFCDAFGETAPPAAPLSWRDDPDLSLSDWTITVKEDRTGVCVDYNVHKALIATGTRKSEYYVRLFTGSGAAGLAENSSRSSTLELQKSAAEAFPDFLDFVYTGTLKIGTGTAVALLHLASYLLNRALYDEVITYMQTALKGKNAKTIAPHFLQEAHNYALEKPGNACTQVCANAFLEAEPGYCLELEPSLYLRVVQAIPRSRSHNDCESLSRHLANYCQVYSESINQELFAQLTSNMPVVAPDAALPLLGLALDRNADNQLKQACTDAAGEKWEHGLFPTVKASYEAPLSGSDDLDSWAPLALSTYPFGLQLRLLSKALVKSHAELITVREEKQQLAEEKQLFLKRMTRAQYNVTYFGQQQPFGGPILAQQPNVNFKEGSFLRTADSKEGYVYGSSPSNQHAFLGMQQGSSRNFVYPLYYYDPDIH